MRSFREIPVHEQSVLLDLAAEADGVSAVQLTEDELAAFAQLLWLEQAASQERSTAKDDAQSSAIDQILAYWPES